MSAGTTDLIGQSGQAVEDIANATAARNNTKPYEKSSVGGAALGGAAKGAAAGMALGPLGAAVGGVIGGAAGGIGAKLGNDAAKDEYLQYQDEMQKQALLSNLPATPQYVPTFANGGSINPQQLANGTKEEMEHTSSKQEAKKIAYDHLKERDDYYKKLKQAGLAESYANGGKVEGDTINNNKSYSNAWGNFYNTQSVYTDALANKYPNIPIKDILTNSVKDSTFSNRNVDEYANSLIGKYGDFNLNQSEMDSISNQGLDIRNIQDTLSKYDNKTVNSEVLRRGNKEVNASPDSLKFGPRMMLERRYDEGNSPYKFLNKSYSTGGNLDNTTVYESGGSHANSPHGGIPIGKNALVEQNEVRWNSPSKGSYIFSDKIPYNKQ